MSSRPRTSIEKALAVLGIIFLLVGLWTVIHPTEQVIFHQGDARFGGGSYFESAGKDTIRFYGVCSIITGGVLIFLAFYPRK